jgi:predicted small lipoprotein YifL
MRYAVICPRRRVLLVALLAVVLAGTITACGRRGPLEPPPSGSQSPITGKVMPA